MIGRPIFFVLLITLLVDSVMAQTRSTGTISGKIVDAKNITPIEYANIILVDTTKRLMVTGAVSDSNGFFRLKEIPAGNYYIEYSFIGYEKKRTKTLTISKKRTNFNLGELELIPSAMAMEEVNIIAEKSCPERHYGSDRNCDRYVADNPFCYSRCGWEYQPERISDRGCAYQRKAIGDDRDCQP
jgi:hypothetical protein